MHGGSKGSGAPFGNQNALKHGFYSGEHAARAEDNQPIVRLAREFLKLMK